MDYIPNEILSSIFEYTSKKNIIECSKVCKKWYQLILTPHYYSTIHIYTVYQLVNFLRLANDIDSIRLINNKSVGYYVHYLYIHIKNMPKKYDSTIFTTFPNIKNIQGIPPRDHKHISNLSHIPNSQLQHLTHFSSWYTQLNNNWMSCINDNVTLLNFYVDDLFNKIDQMNEQQEQLSQSSSPNQFGIKEINEPKTKPMSFNDIRIDHDFNNEEDETPILELTTYSSKIIMLPTLNHLTSLRIRFRDPEQYFYSIYEFDERTFESIHQSCPNLEHLVMDRLNMNISEDYDQIINKLRDEKKKKTTIRNTTILSSSNLAKKLKHFSFIYGIIHDPRCYIYFLNKYPKLESLKLQLEWYLPINLQENVSYKLALFDLIAQSPCLKSLEFNMLHFFNCDFQIGCDEQYWPIMEFSTWLKDHPNQLTSLKYPYDITTINEKKEEETNTDNNNDVDKEDDFNLIMSHSIAQTNYLRHLKYLSINISKLVQSTYSYLTLNNKRQIASLSLEELEINGNNEIADDSDPFYIYRWLDAFPNLLKLTLIDFELIKDVPSRTNRLYVRSFMTEIETEGDLINVMNITKKELMEKGRIVNDNGSNDNNNNNNNDDDDDRNQHKTYKLKELNLKYCAIYFKHGFTLFSKKCPHITKLDFEDVEYSMVDWKISKEQQYISSYIKRNNGLIDYILYSRYKKKLNEYHIIETTFDLSNMDHLDYLSIVNFKYIPWRGEFFEDTLTIQNLNIQETCYLKKNYKIKPTKQEVPVFDLFYKSKMDARDKPRNSYTLNILCKSVFSINFG